MKNTTENQSLITWQSITPYNDMTAKNGKYEPQHPLMRTMIVCEICGNKRCPHASDAGLLCTGSNADGQTGVIERSNANEAIMFLERELSMQMAKVESIKTALATVRRVAAEKAKEGRMV